MTSLIVFVFDESRKIENCNQFSIFVFRPKYPKSFAIDMTKVPQGEGVLGSNRGRVAWIRSWPPPPSPPTAEVSRKFRDVLQRFLSFRRLILLFCPLWQAARHSTLAEKEKILDFALQLLMSPYRDFLELFRQVDMLFIARG